MTVVVDASVAVKWFLPEPGDAAAQRLLACEETLVAPALIRIEVSGAFVRKFRMGSLAEDDARAVHEAWEQMLLDGTLRLVPDVELYDEAVNSAFASKHDLPDCLYLALGKRLDASVVTADGAMHKRGKLVHKRIALLEGSQPQ